MLWAPTFEFASRDRRTVHGRLNFSSATVSVSPVSDNVDVGIVWRHLRLRPLVAVVKTQVPCQGEEKVKWWFRMLTLVGLGRDGWMSSEPLRSGRRAERGWVRRTSRVKGDVDDVDAGVAGEVVLAGGAVPFWKSDRDRDSNPTCFANF